MFFLGVLLLGGLVLMAIAGVTAAIVILVTGIAIVVMVALGGVLGGRSTSSLPPRPLHGAGPTAAGGGSDAGTEPQDPQS